MKMWFKIVLICICAFIGLGYWIWNYQLTDEDTKSTHILWIKPTDTLDSLTQQLHVVYPKLPMVVLKTHISFAFRNTHIKPGKYNLTGIKSLKNVLLKVTEGRQEKIVLHINTQLKFSEDYFTYLDLKLFYNRQDFMRLKNNQKLNQLFGADTSNFFYCLIPRDYKVFWTITPEEISDSIIVWYRKYWNYERQQLAKHLNLTIPEVITLASIVQSESLIYSERQKIARVYLNRIQAQMPLQADPTLVFANRLRGVKRLLNSDKTIESPYNTYKYKGLPPGPIALTYTTSIESVLHCDTNAFLYFCARAERDGFSNFSKTYAEHLRNAKTYQASLNRNKIFR
jgi:UPF0755 protein